MKGQPTHKSGDKYGYLTLTGKSFSRPFYMKPIQPRQVEVICVCGKIFFTRLSALKYNGKPQSCGCLKSEILSLSHTKHGFAAKNKKRHPLYGVWSNMIERCRNPNFTEYSNYGGRGIIVCDDWRLHPEKFIEWALANGWKKGLTIERKNNDSLYCPENCSCSTQKVQSRNKRTNHNITAFGETKCITDWAADSRCTVTRSGMLTRFYYGWSPEKAISFPRHNTGNTRPKQKLEHDKH